MPIGHIETRTTRRLSETHEESSAAGFVAGLAREALGHPAAQHEYLDRLSRGDLPDVMGALRDFAHQYSFYSGWFTRYIEGLMKQLSDPAHRSVLEHNLEEEQGRRAVVVEQGTRSVARSHAELFTEFKQAIGVDASYARTHPPDDAVLDWRESFRSLCAAEGEAVAVGALGFGTELIVPTVYGQMLRALRDHTSLDADATFFFELHAECDDEHSDDLLQIAEELAEDEGGRSSLAEGMRRALGLRCDFWSSLLERALAMPSIEAAPGEEPQETVTLYDQTASRWARREPRSLSDFTGRPPVFDLVGDVAGLDVLDLGCGEGYCARELMRRGARSVTGVDVSQRMIELARQAEATDGVGIEYRHSDVTRFDADSGGYDVIVAVFLFNYVDIATMRAIMTRARSWLREGGRFVFSVPHPSLAYVHDAEPPFYFEKGELGYFSARDHRHRGRIYCVDGTPLEVAAVHKTFEDYFDALASAGFVRMPKVRELGVRPEHMADNPEFFGPVEDVPLHVAFRVERDPIP